MAAAAVVVAAGGDLTVAVVAVVAVIDRHVGRDAPYRATGDGHEFAACASEMPADYPAVEHLVPVTRRC